VTGSYLLSGEETYLVDEALQRIEAALFPNGRDDFNFTSFAAHACKAADVISTCEMLPMFAQRRLVIVRGVDKWPVAELTSLADYLADASPSTVLVLEAIKLDLRTKAAKTIASRVRHVNFIELQESDLYPWLVRRARGRGMELGRDVPEHLVASIGTSLSQLSMALERVDLFIGGTKDDGPRQVALENIESVIADGRARSVFELTDHVIDGNIGKAMDGLHRLLLTGESPIAINALLTRQFRQLYQAVVARERGMRGSAFASFVGVPPFRVDATAAWASRFDRATASALLEELKETDRRLKSSRLSNTILLEGLLLRLCLGKPDQLVPVNC
jgi:DNA polymerase-3 subunit delta